MVVNPPYHRHCLLHVRICSKKNRALSLIDQMSYFCQEDGAAFDEHCKFVLVSMWAMDVMTDDEDLKSFASNNLYHKINFIKIRK